jgi:hypothetical protein
MNSNNGQSSMPGAGLVGKIVFPILALIALYYLYKFLFTSSDLEGKDRKSVV